jgi:hypothetical protein
MPYNGNVTLNGNVSLWWGHDEDVLLPALSCIGGGGGTRFRA